MRGGFLKVSFLVPVSIPCLPSSCFFALLSVPVSDLSRAGQCIDCASESDDHTIRIGSHSDAGRGEDRFLCSFVRVCSLEMELPEYEGV